MMRWLVALVAAVAVMVVLGSAAHSFMVQEAWVGAVMSAESAAPSLGFGDRISWYLHDLIGMQPLYTVLVLVAFFTAFMVASVVVGLTGLRSIVFASAGAISIFVLFFMLKWQLGTVGVFGARGTVGLGLQMLAGLISGLIFARLSRPREA